MIKMTSPFAIFDQARLCDALLNRHLVVHRRDEGMDSRPRQKHSGKAPLRSTPRLTLKGSGGCDNSKGPFLSSSRMRGSMRRNRSGFPPHSELWSCGGILWGQVVNRLGWYIEKDKGWIPAYAEERHSYCREILVRSTPRLTQKGSGGE